jgi:hypothetical protein
MCELRHDTFTTQPLSDVTRRLLATRGGQAASTHGTIPDVSVAPERRGAGRLLSDPRAMRRQSRAARESGTGTGVRVTLQRSTQDRLAVLTTKPECQPVRPLRCLALLEKDTRTTSRYPRWIRPPARRAPRMHCVTARPARTRHVPCSEWCTGVPRSASPARDRQI